MSQHFAQGKAGGAGSSNPMLSGGSGGVPPLRPAAQGHGGQAAPSAANPILTSASGGAHAPRLHGQQGAGNVYASAPSQPSAATAGGYAQAHGQVQGQEQNAHGDMWLFNVLDGGGGGFEESLAALHPHDVSHVEHAPPRIVFEGDSRNEPSSVAYRLLGRTLDQVDVSRIHHGAGAGTEAMFLGLASDLQDSAIDGQDVGEGGNTTSDSYGGVQNRPKGSRAVGASSINEGNSYDDGADDVKDEDDEEGGADPQKSESRKKSVDINRRYRRKVQNSIYELQAHLELRNLCPQNRRLSRAEAANRSLAYIRALEQKVDRMRRACNLAFILQNMELTQSYLEDLYVMCNWDERKMLPIVMQDLLHVFDFAIAEMWKVDYDSRGAEVLTYAFGVRKSCISSDSESLLNMFEISSERMKFAAMQGLPGRAFSMRQSQFLPSASDGAQFLRAKQAEKAGLTSGYAFPIMQGTTVHYVSVFLSTEKRDFNYILFNAVQSLFTILSSIHFSNGLKPTSRSDAKA